MKNRLEEKSSDNLEPRNIVFLDFINIEKIKEKRVLDIGCGFGWLEYRLKDKVRHITGMDVNIDNITKAKSEIHSKNVDFLIGSALKLPFKDNSFNVVISSEVIEHIQKNCEKKYFKEIERVLKRGGRLFLSTPFDDFRSKLFDPAWWIIGHRHYSIKCLNKFINKNKLKIINIKICGRFWGMLGLLNLYISKWIFRRKKFFENYFYKKELSELKNNSGWLNLMVEYKK